MVTKTPDQQIKEFQDIAALSSNTLYLPVRPEIIVSLRHDVGFEKEVMSGIAQTITMPATEQSCDQAKLGLEIQSPSGNLDLIMIPFGFITAILPLPEKFAKLLDIRFSEPFEDDRGVFVDIALDSFQAISSTPTLDVCTKEARARYSNALAEDNIILLREDLSDDTKNKLSQITKTFIATKDRAVSSGVDISKPGEIEQIWFTAVSQYTPEPERAWRTHQDFRDLVGERDKTILSLEEQIAKLKEDLKSK